MSSHPQIAYHNSLDDFNLDSSEPSQDDALYSESYGNNDEQYGYGTVDPYLEHNHLNDEGNELLNSYGCPQHRQYTIVNWFCVVLCIA